MHRMVTRKLYIALYRQVLQIEFKKSHMAFFSANYKIIISKEMEDIKEKELYNEIKLLQEKLSAKEIFSYHDFVLNLLRKEGESVIALKKATLEYSIKCKRYCTSSSSTSTSSSTTLPSNTSIPSTDALITSNSGAQYPSSSSSFSSSSFSSSTTATSAHNTQHNEDLKVIPIPKGITKGHSLSGIGTDKHGSDVESEGPGSSPLQVNSNQTLSISFTVKISRLAVTVLEETAPSQSAHISRLYTSVSMFQMDETRTADNVRSVLSLIVYGTHVTVRTAGDEKELSGRIGSVRTYGLSGVELLSCGSDPHNWMDQGVETLGSGLGSGQGSGGDKVEDKQEYAAELSVRKGKADTSHNLDSGGDNVGHGKDDTEHYGVELGTSSYYTDINNRNSSNSGSSSSSSSSSSSTSEGTVGDDEIRKVKMTNQTAIEVSVSPLTATWDSQTLHLLRTLTDHLTRTLSCSSPLGHVSIPGPHAHALHRLKAASLSMFKSSIGQVTGSNSRYAGLH